MTTLLLVEHDNHTIKTATDHVVTAAAAWQGELHLLVLGHECARVAKIASGISGVARVLLADAPYYEHQLPENSAALIARLGKNYDVILAPATTFGKNVLPRVAALLDSAMLSDVMRILSPDTFVRPLYAGNILATVQSTDAIKILTIRATAFKAASRLQTPAAPILQIAEPIENTLARFERQQLTVSKRPALSDAHVIVSGGRGLKSAENFKLIEELADKLNGAVGASRAAVDAGFAPNDYQVGQTGKVVAPDLYFAIGISGAIQHVAGIKESKVIVAINNDPEAPICQIADYVLIGDLFKIVPELILALSE